MEVAVLDDVRITIHQVGCSGYLFYFWINNLQIFCTHFLICSLGCTIITFIASYENYPSGHALKDLHQYGNSFPFLSLLWVFCLIKIFKHIGCVTLIVTSNVISPLIIHSLAGNLGNHSNEKWIHIDTFSAMNGISRFCENDFPWRYAI